MNNPLIPGMYDMGAGVLGFFGFAIWGFFSLLSLAIAIGLIFLLVRFLLVATRAAQLYVAKNEPPKPPAAPRPTPTAPRTSAAATPPVTPASPTTAASAAPTATTKVAPVMPRAEAPTPTRTLPTVTPPAAEAPTSKAPAPKTPTTTVPVVKAAAVKAPAGTGTPKSPPTA